MVIKKMAEHSALRYTLPDAQSAKRKNREREGKTMDKESFILGMITAFSECVAGGCKRLALSPPLTGEDFSAVGEEARRIIERHGLIAYHEQNLDLPEKERFEWLLIAARRETIDAYLALRASGESPARSLSPFSQLLSYDPVQGVKTSYDAYREYFPLKR